MIRLRFAAVEYVDEGVVTRFDDGTSWGANAAAVCQARIYFKEPQP